MSGIGFLGLSIIIATVFAGIDMWQTEKIYQSFKQKNKR